MKASSIITVVLATVISGSAFAGAAQHVAHNQHNRIAQGVASGSLTKAEAHVVIKQQNQIKHAMKAAGADGKVTPREANGIKHMQGNANQAIYHLKHN